jgi:ElaB/YqjD/DUF883 family membrane-anchored ribosome-binding protein
MSNVEKTKHALEKKADQAGGIWDEVQDKGEELLDEVKDQGLKMWDRAQDRGEDAWKDLMSVVRKHPSRAIGFAFLAGVVAYAFLNRKED